MCGTQPHEMHIQYKGGQSPLHLGKGKNAGKGIERLISKKINESKMGYEFFSSDYELGINQ